MPCTTTPRPINLLPVASGLDCHLGARSAVGATDGAEASVSAVTVVPGAPAVATRTTLMTAEDVAREWQVSTSLIYKLRREGKLRFVRIGTLYRFDPEVIRAHVRGEVTTPRRVR